MSATMLLLLIEVTGPALPRDADLADCTGGAPDAIVVCGRREGSRGYRLPLPDERHAPVLEGLPRAEVGLFGGARAGITTEQAGIGGFQSNRVMVRLRIPLGRRP